MTGGRFKAFEPFVMIAVTKKHTSLRPKLKLASMIRPEIWPTRAPKRAKKQIVWRLSIESFKGGIMTNDFRW